MEGVKGGREDGGQKAARGRRSMAFWALEVLMLMLDAQLESAHSR